MRILYPEHPLEKSQADEPYQEEYLAVKAAGYPCSLFEFDALTFDEFKPHPKIEAGEPVLYRGWMLNSKAYKQFTRQIESKGGQPITSYDEYLHCHHLPGWYEQCSHWTAETHFFEPETNFEEALKSIDWGRYFVKDFVKSNTADQGSIAKSPSEVAVILNQISTYRGEIEGGVAIRQVENYKAQTECRYFVVRGNPYSLNEQIPELVEEVAKAVDAPFYSVDVIENLAGELCLVELGDGQVSDKKAWPISKFVEVLAALAS